ncbi:MAG: tetratricopeptide repeat protein, partial [Deltaproteobacteria bacterium]|nr:tetratricopeptide repeat protein [Deltaproteobacteria bacterium]
MTQIGAWAALCQRCASLAAPTLRAQARALAIDEAPPQIRAWLWAAACDWARAVQTAREDGDLGAAAQLADLAGWEGVALDLWRAWSARDPHDPRPRHAQLALWARRRVPIGLAPISWDRTWLDAARDDRAVLVARAVAGCAAADPAWVAALADQPHRPPAAQAALAIAIGQVATAEAILDAALDRGDPGADTRGARATLHRWRGDAESAERQALLALASDPGNATAHATLGALACRSGRFDAAVDHLARAAASDPADDEALAWLARAHLGRGDRDRAQAALDRCVLAARGFSLPAALLRLLASDAGPTVGRMEGVLPALLALWPDRLRGLDGEALWRAAEALLGPTLDRLGNNLSDQTSLGQGRELVRWTPPPSPRHACRGVLEAAHVAAAEEVTLALDALIAAHPTSPIPLAYAGEWQLWIGDLDCADRCLRAAVDRWPWVRWPHAGLATVRLLRGEFSEALRWLDLGRQRLGGEGPPWQVLRGEIAWRQGRLDAAVDHLRRAVAAQPSRVAAQVLLGLAGGDRGDRQAAAGAVAWLADAAPGLHGD